MNEPHTHAVGSIVGGRYRVEGVIGRGGMGVVLRAVPIAGGPPVAVKILTPDAMKVADSVARFEQEIRVASRIRSDHVVTVIEVGRAEDGASFLVMELLDGIDLATLVDRRGVLPLPEAVGLILQSCAGVAAAHASGLVHRDLKPANLFLSRRPSGPPIVKVLDFGLSKIVLGEVGVGLTQTKTALGTPMYMAPEQVMSSKHIDARCDQHALAMVLYELVTAHPPYEFDSASALAVAIATHAPPSTRAYRPDVPEQLDAAIRRALAKRPGDRFADLGELARALEPFAPPGGSDLARTIEETLTPLRVVPSDGEQAPTVAMALPENLFPTAIDGHGSVVVTASPVAGEPRARSSGGRSKVLLLLVGVIFGVASVATGLFVVASRLGWLARGAPSASVPAPAFAEAPIAEAPPTSTPVEEPSSPPAASALPAASAPAAPAAASASAAPPASASASSVVPRPRVPRAPRRDPAKDPLQNYD